MAIPNHFTALANKNETNEAVIIIQTVLGAIAGIEIQLTLVAKAKAKAKKANQLSIFEEFIIYKLEIKNLQLKISFN